MAGVTVGVWFQANRPVREIVDWARLAESVGVDFVGVTDGQMIWREAYVALAAVAVATSRVRLGPWVTNPLTRHPTVTASAICTLDELSDGRAFLAIATGGDSVFTIDNRPIDKRPVTLAELGEAIGMIRSLASGEEIVVKDRRWHLATARPESPPPIYSAAAGGAALAAGGSFADGVIDSGWLVPEMLSAAVAEIESGATRAGRDPSGVAKIFNSGLALSADGAAARNLVKTYVANGLTLKRSTGVPGWSEEQRVDLAARYDMYQHFSPTQPAAAFVPDELVARKAIAGTPEEAVDLLKMVIAAGYTQIALTPFGDVAETVRLFGEQVLPRL
ncbi:MAG: 5,10-methylenetetrahydromethanopterin reductase [Chloroflexota bacterium]|jgi:alkanesulfonate monooxygenase SsuD/methylene tetrahydromethanopterin reductase-like flavin-dependent oxidoreductase (luciferase family)|nr:5,10-methylenetetrahydromethanopterin reductase [Chloroflexota bacterium]